MYCPRIVHVALLLPVFLLAATAALPTFGVAGIVLDAATMQPLEGVRVSLQATTEIAMTDSSGAFDLPGAQGANLKIVGAFKGYYNEAVIVSSPETNATILLEPIAHGNNPNYAFVPPTNCGNCHPDQFSQWTDSPMAKAGTNTWVYDIYDGTGSPGGMGGFVYTRDSAFASSNPESECASCHQPEPWVQAPFSALEPIGSLSEGSLHGISCEVCHKISNVDESMTNFPGIWPGVVTLDRPDQNQVQYGVLDADYELFGVMRPAYNPQLEAETCAACHQDKNDPDEDHNFEEANGVISEPTYLEWLASPYGDEQDPMYTTCVDCHMPPFGATHVAPTLAGIAPARDPETIRSHRIEGTTPTYLENAVEVSVDTARDAAGIDVDVTIVNSLTGHHVPTGVTVRNMILLVEAFDASDDTPLVSVGSQTVHALGGVGDPAQGYYAGLPGKFYAKVNHDISGAGPTFFTDATGITFDSRIPALASDVTNYRFALPPGTSAVDVRARLIYRRAFRFLVDAKQWTTDGHGNPLEDVAAPYYGHLMEEVVTTSCEPLGTSYCFASPNSISATGATITASCSDSVAANQLALSAGPVPQGEHGVFFHGNLQAADPFGDGLRCVAGNVVRMWPPMAADASGTLTIELDNAGPHGMHITAGATRHFQCWYRDPGGPSSFNLSDAVTITFTP